MKKMKMILSSIIATAMLVGITVAPAMNAYAECYADCECNGYSNSYSYTPGMYSAAGETGNHIRDGVWGNKLDVIPQGTSFYVSDVVDGLWGYVADGVETYDGFYVGYVYLPYCSVLEEYSNPVWENNNVPTWEEPSSEYTYLYYITSEYGAWLRATADFSEGNKLGILSTGQALNVTKVVNDWIYVKDTTVENDYSVYSGWVYAGNASTNNQYVNTTPSGAMNFDENSDIYYNYFITSKVGAWLRESPDGEKIVILNTGDPVNVYEMTDTWARVSCNGYTGWVYRNCISPDTTEVSKERYFDYVNEGLIYNFLVNVLGLPDAAAIGILANIMYESGFDPTASCIDTNGLESLGICQWNGDRYYALVDFCNYNGYDPYSLDGQLAFLEHEFYTTFNVQYNQLLGTYDRFQAAYYFASSFEYCSRDQWTPRANYATSHYN